MQTKGNISTKRVQFNTAWEEMSLDILLLLVYDNVQIKNTEKPNAEGFGRLLSLYALGMCTDYIFICIAVL